MLELFVTSSGNRREGGEIRGERKRNEGPEDEWTWSGRDRVESVTDIVVPSQHKTLAQSAHLLVMCERFSHHQYDNNTPVQGCLFLLYPLGERLEGFCGTT